jgi:MFS family permease
LFYLSSAASGAFSGLLAAGIAQLDGTAGLRGWRWIFILEGIISVAFGVGAFFLLPDTPTLSGRWLSENEIRYLNLIHYATRGAGAGKSSAAMTNPEAKKRFNWKIIRQIVTDRNLYLQAIIFASNTIPNNGLKVS